MRVQWMCGSSRMTYMGERWIWQKPWLMLMRVTDTPELVFLRRHPWIFTWRPNVRSYGEAGRAGRTLESALDMRGPKTRYRCGGVGCAMAVRGRSPLAPRCCSQKVERSNSVPLRGIVRHIRMLRVALQHMGSRHGGGT